MSTNIQDPKFIYPVNDPSIFYHPVNARYILSQHPVKRGSVIKLGDFERSVKHSEELTIIVFPAAGRLRIVKGFMQITSLDGLMQFVQLLGFGDRRSFLLATMNYFDTDGYTAKRKLFIHHLYEDTILPPI